MIARGIVIGVVLSFISNIHTTQITVNKNLEERLKKIHFQSIALENEEAKQHAKQLFKEINAGNVAAVEKLLTDGLRVASFINIKNKTGQSSLMIAIEALMYHLQKAKIKLAVERRTKEHLPENTKTLVTLEKVEDIFQRYRAILVLLIEAGVDLDAQDADGNTALIKAVYYNEPALVQKLIDVHANLNLQNKQGNSALQLAARDKSYMDSLLLLLAARADLNLKDGIGQTALMYAAEVGDTEVVEKLLAAGADMTIKNELDHGKTALDYAKEERHKGIVALLEPVKRVTSPGYRPPSVRRREEAARLAEEKQRLATVTPPSDEESRSSTPFPPQPSPSPFTLDSQIPSLSPSPVSLPHRSSSQRSTSSSPFKPATPTILEEE